MEAGKEFPVVSKLVGQLGIHIVNAGGKAVGGIKTQLQEISQEAFGEPQEEIRIILGVKKYSFRPAQDMLLEKLKIQIKAIFKAVIKAQDITPVRFLDPFKLFFRKTRPVW